jgi:hypothetical protein
VILRISLLILQKNRKTPWLPLITPLL